MPLRVPPLVRRILSRLIDAETQETDPWLRDDLQIARLTVAYAARGEAVLCSPDVLASYAVLGLHPEKVWPAIQREGRRCLGHCAKLWARRSFGKKCIRRSRRNPSSSGVRKQTARVPQTLTQRCNKVLHEPR